LACATIAWDGRLAGKCFTPTCEHRLFGPIKHGHRLRIPQELLAQLGIRHVPGQFAHDLASALILQGSGSVPSQPSQGLRRAATAAPRESPIAEALYAAAIETGLVAIAGSPVILAEAADARGTRALSGLQAIAREAAEY
jgi:hypothetical protein